MDRHTIGAAGGRSTFIRHGKAHMQAIGRKGFQSTLARHFAGDRIAFRQWLAAKAWNATADILADREIAQRLEAGEVTVCIELPHIDDDLPY